MSFGELSYGEKAELAERYELGGIDAIRGDAHSLGIRPESLRRMLNQLLIARDIWAYAGAIAPIEEEKGTDDWEKLCHVIGRPPNAAVPAGTKPAAGRARVCVIADMHGNPDFDGLQTMLGRESPDLVVIAGDTLDHYLYSTWPKDRLTLPNEELAAVTVAIEMLAVSAQVKIIYGNHDVRRERHFARLLKAHEMDELKDPPLQVIADAMPQVELVRNEYDYVTPTGRIFAKQLHDTFMCFLGDAVIAHPERSRKAATTSAESFLKDFYEQWQHVLGLPANPALVAIGHTHGAAISWSKGGHQVIAELGTMMRPSAVQYVLSNRARAACRPPAHGYLAFYLDNGLVDIPSVGFHVV
jgi:predicted phosphodiesterase